MNVGCGLCKGREFDSEAAAHEFPHPNGHDFGGIFARVLRLRVYFFVCNKEHRHLRGLAAFHLRVKHVGVHFFFLLLLLHWVVLAGRALLVPRILVVLDVIAGPASKARVSKKHGKIGMGWALQAYFQPFESGVHSRPKSALMLVARLWFSRLDRMSRRRSASCRNMLFGRLKHIARAGHMPRISTSLPPSASASASASLLKIFPYSNQPPLLSGPCGSTGERMSGLHRICEMLVL